MRASLCHRGTDKERMRMHGFEPQVASGIAPDCAFNRIHTKMMTFVNWTIMMPLLEVFQRAKCVLVSSPFHLGIHLLLSLVNVPLVAWEHCSNKMKALWPGALSPWRGLTCCRSLEMATKDNPGQPIPYAHINFKLMNTSKQQCPELLCWKKEPKQNPTHYRFHHQGGCINSYCAVLTRHRWHLRSFKKFNTYATI